MVQTGDAHARELRLDGEPVLDPTAVPYAVESLPLSW